jgi:hypothetical protein
MTELTPEASGGPLEQYEAARAERERLVAEGAGVEALLAATSEQQAAGIGPMENRVLGVAQFAADMRVGYGNIVSLDRPLTSGQWGYAQTAFLLYTRMQQRATEFGQPALVAARPVDSLTAGDAEDDDTDANYAEQASETDETDQADEAMATTAEETVDESDDDADAITAEVTPAKKTSAKAARPTNLRTKKTGKSKP